MITVRINGHDEGCMSQDPDGGPCTCPTNNKTVLYSVTTIVHDGSSGGSDKRTPAICVSLRRAKQIVEANEGDIWEGLYKFVVIEAVTADVVYGFHDELYWYAWDLEKKCYTAIECPENYRTTVRFGIG